ncbi:hypothetical protein HW115_13895 [Verrucomicrobiaceae bacterium N1E253]|uniref:Uncharacterized protein n=1 Tax=Oceaniferula marina TaxID=2748318 RepID=A0A851GLK2_9BACT|nr:hypothetical protein [Oceaniferula marina]NWK56711.1 hypothetical protein [Oceaniferula marina]
MQEITKTGRIVVVIALLIIAGLLSATAVSLMQGSATSDRDELETWTPGDKQHFVEVRKPDHIPMVDSGKKDKDGNPVMVRCNNCHDTQKTNMLTENAKDLKNFHQHMSFQHQSLKCVSCHNPDDHESLRLADSSTISFVNVIELCAQCHGPQYRDFKNGSHGGMTGYWDLSRGGRKRNNCVDCHDPHHPAYPKVMPVFPPKSRVGTTGTSKH